MCTTDRLAEMLAASNHRVRELEDALRAAQGEIRVLRADREFSLLLAEGIGRDLTAA